jgi:hypothetical protein
MQLYSATTEFKMSMPGIITLQMWYNCDLQVIAKFITNLLGSYYIKLIISIHQKIQDIE